MCLTGPVVRIFYKAKHPKGSGSVSLVHLLIDSVTKVMFLRHIYYFFKVLVIKHVKSDELAWPVTTNHKVSFMTQNKQMWKSSSKKKCFIWCLYSLYTLCMFTLNLFKLVLSPNKQVLDAGWNGDICVCTISEKIYTLWLYPYQVFLYLICNFR